MEKKYDTFDYEIKRVMYNDSCERGDGLLRCVFMINGEDILDIIEKCTEDEDYHHITLSDLGIFDLNDDPYKPGRIHLLVCYCEELGCGNISVKVTEKEDSVIWDSFRDSEVNDDQNLKLSFEFEKSDYMKKMEEIKAFASTLCRK